ncbi:endonuclease-reverse transcriptase [Plakobranchus ocellatus]|uniref:Endonuclease-reverse transcriptase n=1 Tax=Plakobranchus ocellatus TaxID=259542 RepID=A0AAV3YR60_9GAST|nr:endonuclease-reverse transcriptase [Plakobranchus ocellatus]
MSAPNARTAAILLERLLRQSLPSVIGNFSKVVTIICHTSDYQRDYAQVTRDRDHLSSITKMKAPHILEEHVQMSLKKIKKGKAARVDDIPSEMLTPLVEFGMKEVTKLLNTIHTTGEIPTEFKKSVNIAQP